MASLLGIGENAERVDLKFVLSFQSILLSFLSLFNSILLLF
jgi:hypothetical protein